MHTSGRPLGQVRRAALVASAFSASIGVLMLALPVFALHMFEAALPAASLELLLVLVGIAAGALLVAGVLDYCRELILLRAALWLDHTIGLALLEAGLAQGDRPEALESRSDAVAALRTGLAGGALLAVLDLPWGLIACGAIVLLHPLLGAACAAGIAALALCLLALQLATSRQQTELDEARAGSARQLASWIRNAGPAAAHGIAAGAACQWDLSNRACVATAYRIGCRTGLARAAARTLNVAALIGVLAYGGTLVVADGLAPGVVIAAVLVLARTLASLEQVVAGWETIRAARRAWRLLRTAPLSAAARGTDRPTGIQEHAGRITIEAASFRYPGRRTPALDNVTLDIVPGECIGIIGARGAGKSALAAMIAGIAGPASGRADLDGAPIVHQQRAMALRAIGYAPDEPRLIDGSVIDNIAGFGPRSQANVARAAIRAGVHEVLAALPEGYATKVGADGSGLPMRARRAVALARALHGNPRLVVLDEPELGLDEAALGRLVSTLEDLRACGIGLVLATSEPRLLGLTDRIVLLSAGRVEAVLPSRQVNGTIERIRQMPKADSVRQVA